MKKILRRVKMNLMRKSGRFVLKCVVFLLFFTMLFTSVYIQHVSKQLENNILSNYDIYVEISSRLHEIHDTKEYFKASQQYVDIYNDLSQNENVSYSDMGVFSYSGSMVQTIQYNKENDVVKYYNTSFAQSEFENIANNIKFNEENEKGIYAVSNTQTIKSVRNSVPSDFEFDVVNLVLGRTFTQEEIDEGKAVCLVPVGYHYDEYPTDITKSQAKIGNKIPISVLVRDANNVYYYKEIEFEIIGMYSIREDLQVRDNISGIEEYYDYIYIPELKFEELYNEAIPQVLEQEGYDYFEYRYDYFLGGLTEVKGQTNTYRLGPMIFRFDNIDKLEGFLEHLDEYSNYFPNDYTYYSTVDDMYQSISNVLSVSKSIQYISIVCLIICITISIMILLFDINSRKKEIGILLSMGETLKDIVVQFTIELLIVSLISFAGSFVITNVVSDYCVDYLIETQINSDEVDSFLPEGYETDSEVYNEILEPAPLSKSMPMMMAYLTLICGTEIICMAYMIQKIDPKELLKDE